MSKILVTGAAGHLGRKTLEQLLKRKPAHELVGLARDPAKAADLAAQSIEIRQGDYSDFGSLPKAFEGVEKLLLVATHAFTDRETQHRNVISAAQQAGVKHIVYTPVVRREGSDFVLAEATLPDLATEQALKESGVAFTLVRQPPFLDTLPFMFGEQAYEVGVRVPAGTGKVGALAREDIAEAQAVVLSEDGHQNKVYSLIGDPAVSFADIAEVLSRLSGTLVPYVEVSEQQYIDDRVAEGLPPSVAEFALAWVRGINRGEWGEQTGDLEHLIGRKPTTIGEFFKDHYHETNTASQKTSANV